MEKLDWKSIIRSTPESQEKRKIISHLRESGIIRDEDLIPIIAEQIAQNASMYEEEFRNDARLRNIWRRFESDPFRLARALAQVRPDLFYSFGLAYRISTKLKANLGVVLVEYRLRDSLQDMGVMMQGLSDHVRGDIIELDKERVFREFLYPMSVEPTVGFEFLEERLAKAQSDYDRWLLESVREHCRKLVAMEFPFAVDSLNDFRFPSFHVRWWIDQAATIPRVLNAGDTATQKTAFSTIGLYHYGCRKILVLCTPHARTQWLEEIKRYFRDDIPVQLIATRRDVTKILSSNAVFTVVGYSTLIGKGVSDILMRVPFDGLIWDECHYAKNVTGENPAKRAQQAFRLASQPALKHIAALSATPWENDPIDLLPFSPHRICWRHEYQQNLYQSKTHQSIDRYVSS